MHCRLTTPPPHPPRMHAHIHAHTHACMHTPTCMHAQTHLAPHARMAPHGRTHVRTHARIHTSSYTCRRKITTQNEGVFKFIKDKNCNRWPLTLTDYLNPSWYCWCCPYSSVHLLPGVACIVFIHEPSWQSQWHQSQHSQDVLSRQTLQDCGVWEVGQGENCLFTTI